jgi:hypothetical protein
MTMVRQEAPYTQHRVWTQHLRLARAKDKYTDSLMQFDPPSSDAALVSDSN